MQNLWTDNKEKPTDFTADGFLCILAFLNVSRGEPLAVGNT